MNWDALLLQNIREISRNDFLDVIMPPLTHLGDHGIIWILLGLLLLASKRYRMVGVLTLSALALCGITGNIILKNLIARPRPFVDFDIAILIPPPNEFSFPSGHAFSSFSAAGVIAYQIRPWAWPVLIFATLISFSRLYVGVHYPTDVAAGMILGLIVAKLVILANNVYMQRR